MPRYVLRRLSFMLLQLLVLAVLVACQRVESGFHFLSDVLVGAAVGLVVGVMAPITP